MLRQRKPRCVRLNDAQVINLICRECKQPIVEGRSHLLDTPDENGEFICCDHHCPEHSAKLVLVATA